MVDVTNTTPSEKTAQYRIVTGQHGQHGLVFCGGCHNELYEKEGKFPHHCPACGIKLQGEDRENLL